jgi:hypothetical protein
MNYRMLPDEILEEWTTQDVKEFLTYHRVLSKEHAAAMKKRK